MSWIDLLERLGDIPAEAWLVPPILIMAVIVAIGVSLHRARLRRYDAIAVATGLSVKSGIVQPSQVHGTYSGRQVVMMTRSARSAGSFRKTWTIVTVDVRNRVSVGLRLRRRDVIDRLFRLGNAPVGDDEFDHRFLILSRDPGYVLMIFGDRTLRAALLLADIEGVRLVDSTLEVFYRREVRSAERAVLLLDAAVGLANAVERLGAGRS